MLTPDHQNEFIDFQKDKGQIVVRSITDVTACLIWPMELLELTYRLCEYTFKWLKNATCGDYQTLFTPQDEWKIGKYVMDILRQFRYWTHWMLKRHSIVLHYVMTV
jgi:hypothetical protein